MELGKSSELLLGALDLTDRVVLQLLDTPVLWTGLSTADRPGRGNEIDRFMGVLDGTSLVVRSRIRTLDLQKGCKDMHCTASMTQVRKSSVRKSSHYWPPAG